MLMKAVWLAVGRTCATDSSVQASLVTSHVMLATTKRYYRYYLLFQLT